MPGGPHRRCQIFIKLGMIIFGGHWNKIIMGTNTFEIFKKIKGQMMHPTPHVYKMTNYSWKESFVEKGTT